MKKILIISVILAILLGSFASAGVFEFLVGDDNMLVGMVPGDVLGFLFPGCDGVGKAFNVGQTKAVMGYVITLDTIDFVDRNATVTVDGVSGIIHQSETQTVNGVLITATRVRPNKAVFCIGQECEAVQITDNSVTDTFGAIVNNKIIFGNVEKMMVAPSRFKRSISS